MSAVWILLLDVSGSMGEGFSAKPVPTDPFAETGLWATKLEAAKEILVRNVRATRGQDIAVISFSSSARLQFKCSLEDFDAWETEFRRLQPRGKTNLAQALILAKTEEEFEPYDAISFLILSDGLSNVGNPKKAAEDLIEKYPHSRIDTILIDDTPEGRQTAEAVSINGWVRPGESFLQLDQAVESGRAVSMRQGLASMAYQRFDVEYALADATHRPVPALLTMSSPSTFELTPETLRNQLAPALYGLEEIQRVESDLDATPYRGKIGSISQASPVSVSVSGWEKVLELFHLIFRWGREHAKTMARLREQKLTAEIEKIQAESAEGLARAQHMSAEADRIDFETQLRREESERLRLELRKNELVLLQERIKFAERLFQELAGERDVPEIERAAYVQRLADALELVTSSKLEFEVQREPIRDY